MFIKKMYQNYNSTSHQHQTERCIMLANFFILKSSVIIFFNGTEHMGLGERWAEELIRSKMSKEHTHTVNWKHLQAFV